MGALGMASAILTVALMKEPVTKALDKKEEDEKPFTFSDLKSQLKEMFTGNDVCKYTFIASGFRSFGNMAVSTYLPVFFMKVYP